MAQKSFFLFLVSGLLLVGAGCGQRQTPPIQAPVELQGAEVPTVPTEPTQAPVIPQAAQKVPVPEVK